MKIQRNDEEQTAFEALVDALRNAPEGDDVFATAESIEHRLLELGFVITEIPPIKIV